MKDEAYFDFLKGERRFQITFEKGKTELLEKQKNQAINDFSILEAKSKSNN